jgi:hypothetical protein
MKNRIRWATASVALVSALALAGPAQAVTADAEQSSPAESTFESNTGAATTDSYTTQQEAADAAAGYSFHNCLEKQNSFSDINIGVKLKACVERSPYTGEKRMKVRATCFYLSTGGGSSCHHWWSQDPRGHLATYRFYTWSVAGGHWYVEAYSNVRAPALNVSTSVAYSDWASDQSNKDVYGALRNLGVTLTGGKYAYPFSKNTGIYHDI